MLPMLGWGSGHYNGIFLPLMLVWGSESETTMFAKCIDALSILGDSSSQNMVIDAAS